MNCCKGLLIALSLLCLVNPARPQQSPAPQPQLQQRPITTLQVHARAVVLDVVVTDAHGHPVHGLTAKDFQLLEDGNPQTITNFEETKPPTEAERALLAGATLPLNTFSNANKVMAGGASGTYTVLLLDALNTRPEYQAQQYEQMKKWVDSAVLTGPVAIFSLDTSLHLVQGFTNDIATLRTAVHNYRGVVLSPIPQGRGAGFPAQQMRLGGLTGAMSSISQYLAKFPGRKNLIWFTGSLPVTRRDDGDTISTPIYDPESFTFDFSTATDLLTLGRVSLYPVDVEGLRANPAFDASHSGVPSNRAITGFDMAQGTKHMDMDEAAHATGGKAFYNTNDIKGAINQVIESGSSYYTLTYYPTNKNWNGKFRKLKVDLDLPGDQLEYRRGYYALTDARPGSSVKRAVAGTPRRQITQHSTDDFGRAMHLGSVDPGTIVFEAHITPDSGIQKLEKGAPLPDGDFMEPRFRNKPYREFEVDYKVPGRQFQLTPSSAGTMTGQVEFALVLLDDQGMLVNSYTATVDMNLKPETYAYMMKNGVEFPARIAVPVKGNYFIRAGVHDIPSDHSGALEVNVAEIKPEK